MFLKLVVLYLEYDKEKYPNSFDMLQKYLKKIKCFQKKIVIIDNANSTQETIEVAKNIYKISGDNSCWEFSGWQKGLIHLKENNIKYDLILFVNDSFLSYGGSFLSKKCGLIALKSLITDSAVGQIDSYENNISILKYTLKDYLRSNCFFIPKKILDKIARICMINNEDLKQYVDDDYSGKFFKAEAPLSDNFKNEIVHWLSSEWHSKFEIKDNWTLFKHKLRAMLNEILLSAKINEAGFNISNYDAITKTNYRKLKENE